MTPVRGTAAKFWVLFGRANIASRDVAADLVGADVEGGSDLDVADVIAAELDVHQARHRLVGLGLAIVGQALHEG